MARLRKLVVPGALRLRGEDPPALVLNGAVARFAAGDVGGFPFAPAEFGGVNPAAGRPHTAYRRWRVRLLPW